MDYKKFHDALYSVENIDKDHSEEGCYHGYKKTPITVSDLDKMMGMSQESLDPEQSQEIGLFLGGLAVFGILQVAMVIYFIGAVIFHEIKEKLSLKKIAEKLKNDEYKELAKEVEAVVKNNYKIYKETAKKMKVDVDKFVEQAKKKFPELKPANKKWNIGTKTFEEFVKLFNRDAILRADQFKDCVLFICEEQHLFEKDKDKWYGNDDDLNKLFMNTVVNKYTHRNNRFYINRWTPHYSPPAALHINERGNTKIRFSVWYMYIDVPDSLKEKLKKFLSEDIDKSKSREDIDVADTVNFPLVEDYDIFTAVDVPIELDLEDFVKTDYERYVNFVEECAVIHKNVIKKKYPEIVYEKRDMMTYDDFKNAYTMDMHGWFDNDSVIKDDSPYKFHGSPFIWIDGKSSSENKGYYEFVTKTINPLIEKQNDIKISQLTERRVNGNYGFLVCMKPSLTYNDYIRLKDALGGN